jgi:hypothetical protein
MAEHWALSGAEQQAPLGGTTTTIACYQALRGVPGNQAFDVLFAADASTRLLVA